MEIICGNNTYGHGIICYKYFLGSCTESSLPDYSFLQITAYCTMIGCFIIEDTSNHLHELFFTPLRFFFFHSMIDHCLCFASNIHTRVFYFDSEKKTDIIENMTKLNSFELASFLLFYFWSSTICYHFFVTLLPSPPYSKGIWCRCSQLDWFSALFELWSTNLVRLLHLLYSALVSRSFFPLLAYLHQYLFSMLCTWENVVLLLSTFPSVFFLIILE